MHASSFRLGRATSAFFVVVGLFWFACNTPPTLTPKLNSACSTNADCAGSWTCQQGQCKAAQVQTNVCQENATRACYTAKDGCSQAGDSYKCVGACKAGTQTCKSNAWGACTGEVSPGASDACGNQLDDDCDGKTDEGCTCTNGQSRPCYEASTGCTKTGETYACVGACKAGTQTCENNAWAACKDAIAPSTEVCGDGIDNNCDGKTDGDDEACGLPKCTDATPCQGKGVCMRTAGKDSGYCLLPCELSNPTCPTNLVCARARIGYGFFCLEVYPPAANSTVPCEVGNLYKTCPRGQLCNPVNALCSLPTNNATEGQTCGSNGDLCIKDHFCLPMPATGRCVQQCDNGSCPTSKTCVQFKHPNLEQSRKLCIKSCTSNANCDAKEKCVTVGSQLNGGKIVAVKGCVDSGPRKRWESCELFGENCEKDLRCYIPAALYDRRPVGLCAPENCNGQADCSPLPDTSIQTACKGVNCAACAGILPTTDVKQCVITCVDDPTVCNKFGTFCGQPDLTQPKYCVP